MHLLYLVAKTVINAQFNKPEPSQFVKRVDSSTIIIR